MIYHFTLLARGQRGDVGGRAVKAMELGSMIGGVPADAAVSLYRHVANRLRADILDGTWRSDARLKVRDLATHYGVSPAPIRESLQQLQGEGLVVMEPNRGARVRAIDEQLIINIFDVREALEAFLTAKFADSASPHRIAALEELQAQHDAAVESEDFLAAFVLNGQFHLLINSAARNPEALSVIDRNLSLTRAFRLECGFTPKRMRTIQREHRMLIAAIRAGDATAAGKIAAMHVRSSRDDLLEQLGPRLTRK
jgi:DNA-binding GntR family transcriptional regulator